MYIGAASVGLISLAVVLAATYRARQPGLPPAPASVPLLWRTFWAGAAGPGTGSLPVTRGPRPGPPPLVGLLPVLLGTAALLGLITLAWVRVRPARRPEAAAWDLP